MIEDNADYQAIHAAYPRIADKLKTHWGTTAFVAYMLELTSDTREGARRGFPGEVFFALDALSALHQEEYPELYRSSGTDPWATSVSEPHKH